MKLTTARLKQLIKEELRNIFSEGPSEEEIEQARDRDTATALPTEVGTAQWWQENACAIAEKCVSTKDLEAEILKEFGRRRGKKIIQDWWRELASKDPYQYQIYVTLDYDSKYPEGLWEAYAVAEIPVDNGGYLPYARKINWQHGDCLEGEKWFDARSEWPRIEAGFQLARKELDGQLEVYPCGLVNQSSRVAPKRRRRW